MRAQRGRRAPMQSAVERRLERYLPCHSWPGLLNLPSICGMPGPAWPSNQPRNHLRLRVQRDYHNPRSRTQRGRQTGNHGSIPRRFPLILCKSDARSPCLNLANPSPAHTTHALHIRRLRPHSPSRRRPGPARWPGNPDQPPAPRALPFADTDATCSSARSLA